MADRGRGIGSRYLYHRQPKPASRILWVFARQSLIQFAGILQSSLPLQTVGLLQAFFGGGIHRDYRLIVLIE